MKYLALLRGVNVGGKNILPMKELVTVLRGRGYTEPKTYIQSGNVVFSHASQSPSELATELAGIIVENWKIKTNVAVVPGNEWITAINVAPEWWGHGDGSKHNLFTLLSDTNVDKLQAAFEASDPERERFANHGPFFFQSLRSDTPGEFTTSKAFNKATLDLVTVRNRNTSLKLAELLQE